MADVSGIEWMKQNFLAQKFHPLEQQLRHIELGLWDILEKKGAHSLTTTTTTVAVMVVYHQMSEHSSQMWYLWDPESKVLQQMTQL